MSYLDPAAVLAERIQAEENEKKTEKERLEKLQRAIDEQFIFSLDVVLTEKAVWIPYPVISPDLSATLRRADYVLSGNDTVYIKIRNVTGNVVLDGMNLAKSKGWSAWTTFTSRFPGFTDVLAISFPKSGV